MGEEKLVGQLGGDSLYRNNHRKTTVANSPGPINLDNLICIVNEYGVHISLGHLTPEEKKVELKKLGFSDKTLSEAIIGTPKKEENPAERNTGAFGDAIGVCCSNGGDQGGVEGREDSGASCREVTE